MLLAIDRILLLILSLSFVAFAYFKRRRTPLLPPGPPTIPLIGNFLSIPSEKPWVTYARWSRQYNSDLISVWVLGRLTILVNSQKAAKELFERRSTIYSDRPQMAMIDLMGWDWNTAMIPYSERWRMHRRMLNQNFRAKAALEYRPRQTSNAADLVRRLSEDPEDFIQHIRTFAASVSMAIAYGHKVTSTSDHLVDVADKAFAMLSGAVFPGVMAVNTLPFLRHLPSWLPGMTFKTYARKCRNLTSQMLDGPWAAVKRGMENGCAPASLAATLMHANEVNSTGRAHDEAAKEVSAIAYAAGADTTVSALSTAILALLLHPRVQQRAQREIDSVVGRDRLPSFDDRADLPYVSAVCKEVLRWQVVANLGVPRASLADDVYEGMFIPKGTQIFPNVWAMLHDPEKYPDPEAFKPERFLTTDGRLNNDDVDAAFGFGRRMCSGQHLARSSVWICIASILAVLDIKRSKDRQGKDVPVDILYSSGMVSHPLSFRCSISLRDEKSKALVNGMSSHTR